MARRLFNGNAFSEDGWPYVDEGSCTWIVVPGTNPPVHLQIQNGPPLILLGAWAADWNAYIEPLRDADSACWTPGNSVPTSNHPGGTAEDLNWESHDFQVRGTLNAAQMATMAEMEAFYEGMVFWAGRWDNPVDEMHSQVGYDTYDQQNDRPFPKVLDFISRKIRADGFSTFRRGAAPPPPPPSDRAQTLADATGLDVSRALELLPAVMAGLMASDCTNVNRISMWLAQCGEESAGFSTTEEFASGAEYEGRCSDLGNCSPGDGVKYKGRTWIQITGKAHYREFSEWASGKGFVPSPTQFVDNPASLGDLQWAGVGAAWYWTVARLDINALSDAGDVVTVTHRINGGEHGLAERQRRYSLAHALGDRLLVLVGTAPPQPQPQPPPQPPTGEDDWLNMPSNQEKLDAIYNALFAPSPPENIYREASETVGQNLVDSIRSTLSMTYEGVVERLALLGESASINKVVRVARGQGPEQRPWAVARAQLIWQKGLAGSAAPVTAARMMPTPIAMAPPPQLELPPLTAPSSPPQVVYLPAPVEPEHTNGSVPDEKPKSTGETIGQLYSALEDLKLADALPIEARAPLAALISVLQTKNGSQL